MDTMSINQFSRFDGLDEATKNIVTALLSQKDEFPKALQDQTVAITHLLGRVELIAESQTAIIQQGLEMQFPLLPPGFTSGTVAIPNNAPRLASMSMTEVIKLSQSSFIT